MKRLSVVMLCVMCVCFFGVAPKASAQAIIVDFDAAITSTTEDPATFEGNVNSILDSDEFALLAAILADTGKPQHTAVRAAWVQNRAQMTSDLGIFDSIYGTALAGYMTLGDATSVAAVVALAGGAGVTINPADYDLTQSVVLAYNADPDSDSLDNTTEYTAIAGTGGPSSAKRAQYIVDALTASTFSFTTQPQGANLFIGGNHTFTVATANGVAPLHYQWKRGATNVGTDSASLTISNAQLSDAGSYTCTVTDSDSPTPGEITSNAATLNVYDAGSLPAAGIYGLILLGFLCVGAGVFAIRRVAHR